MDFKPRICKFCRKSGSTTPLRALWLPLGQQSVYAHPSCFRKAQQEAERQKTSTAAYKEIMRDVPSATKAQAYFKAQK